MIHALALLTIVVAPTDPPPASAASTRVVRTWLRELAASKRMDRYVVLPFTFASGFEKKTCEGTARTSEELNALVRCLRRDSLLIDTIRKLDVQQVPVFADSFDNIQKSVSKDVLRGLPDVEVVQSLLMGDGIEFHLWFIVAKNRVRALLMDVSFFD